jgi:hypothetical protein
VWALEGGRDLKSEGRRCGGGRGSLGVYIGAGGAPGRWQPALIRGNGHLNGLQAIDGLGG